jgi:hypothetical protein
MTAKEAVKAHCRDCRAGSRDCTFTDCALKGLAMEKGKVKTAAIKAYCRWCLNGNPFQVCASPDSWRGSIPRPVGRYKGYGAETNTFREQHTPTACGGVVDCAIYQFREEKESRKIGRICGKTGGTEGGMRPFTSKAVQTHGKAEEGGKSGVFPGVRI